MLFPRIKPTPKQHLGYQALKDLIIKFVVFGGGSGGGKSWLGCEWLLTNCYFYPGSKWFMGRNELKRLMLSSFITFQKVCNFHKIPKTDWELNGQYNYIHFRNNSKIDLLDLAYKPSDPFFERFGSLEYTGGWIEEAGEVNFGAFDILKSRVGRHLNTELKIPPKIFVTCNPSHNWLYRSVYKPWKKKDLPEDYCFIQSLYGDNPYTKDLYGKQLATITDRQTRLRLKEGLWEYGERPDALMEYDAITDLFTNTLEESAIKFLVVDVARFGDDRTVFTFWRGLEIYKIEVREKQGTDVTVQTIRDFARDERIPFSHILIDEDGVGGGVVDNLRGVKGFVANSSPVQDPATTKRLTSEKYNYENLRSQCYYLLADKVNERAVAVKTENETIKDYIIEELDQILAKDKDKPGKLKIISKEKIKEALGRSPDFADCLMMRMYFELEKPVIPRQPDSFGGVKPYIPGVG